MPHFDPYKELGIEPSASEKEIKNAYRKLVLKHHPDRNKNSEASKKRFEKIQKAYESILDHRDPKSRRYRIDRKTEEYRNSVKDLFRIRITLNQTELPIGQFQLKVFTLNKIEKLYLKLPPGIELIEQKTTYNIILNIGNEPSMAWNTDYILEVKTSGSFELGPAHFIQNGLKVESEKAFIRVYEEAEFKKKQKSEKTLNRFLVSLSLIFFLFILSVLVYNVLMDKYDPTRNIAPDAGTARAISDNRLSTGTAPYGLYFEHLKSETSQHQIEFIADPYLDQVVFLVNRVNEEVVRHNYILASDTFTMNQIPDGLYYVKVYYGRDWNNQFSLKDKALKGGFNLFRKHISFREDAQLLRLYKQNTNDSLSYASFRFTLFKVAGGDAAASEIDEEQFF